MEMAIHEVEEGCVIFWSVRMAAFAISPANGVWFAEKIVDFLGRSRSSISACGVRAVIFIGFCEQQSARGYECVQVVIVVGQFGIAIFMGRVFFSKPEDIARAKKASDDLTAVHFQTIEPCASDT